MIRRFLILALLCRAAMSADTVSYYKEVIPVFKRSCNGCHHPGKAKGDLDLSSYSGIQKGGKHGAVVKAGESKNSPLIEEVSGDDPSMPKEGDALSKAEVALLERWISEGAKDDTPADKLNPYKLSEPPKYPAPAAISSMQFAPDGSVLAIAG